jgi:simple sugar transport system permease protein
VAGVSPILATLGMMTFVKGLALVCTGGQAISGLPSSIVPVGNGLFCGVPVPLWIFLACALAATVMLERTPWGFKLYMLGANPIAAVFSGVNGRRVLIRTYVLSGLLCGIAGIIMISRFNSAKAGYGESYLLVTILAAVLGGTSAYGGFGRVSGLVLALMILQVISSGLNLLRVNPFLTIAIWGATILAVMGLNLAAEELSRRFAGKNANGS